MTFTVSRDVSAKESRSFGLLENSDMEWTVPCDESMHILACTLGLETREDTFDLEPGDGIWLPDGTWMVDRAEFARAVMVVEPVNRREVHGYA